MLTRDNKLVNVFIKNVKKKKYFLKQKRSMIAMEQVHGLELTRNYHEE